MDFGFQCGRILDRICGIYKIEDDRARDLDEDGLKNA